MMEDKPKRVIKINQEQIHQAQEKIPEGFEKFLWEGKTEKIISILETLANLGKKEKMKNGDIAVAISPHPLSFKKMIVSGFKEGGTKVLLNYSFEHLGMPRLETFEFPEEGVFTYNDFLDAMKESDKERPSPDAVHFFKN